MADDHAQSFFRRDVEVGWKNGGSAHFFNSFARFHLDHFDFVDLVAKKLNPVAVVYIGQIDVHCITTYAKSCPFKLYLGAGIKAFDQFVQKGIAGNDLPLLDADDPGFVIFRIAHTIDAGNRSDDDDVAPP